MNDDRTHDHPDAAGDDWLERLLADDAAAHRDAYVADDGFTARVMARAARAGDGCRRGASPWCSRSWGVAAAGLRGRDAVGDARRRARGLSSARRAAGVAVRHRRRGGRDGRLTWAAAAYSLRVTDGSGSAPTSASGRTPPTLTKRLEPRARRRVRRVDFAATRNDSRTPSRCCSAIAR